MKKHDSSLTRQLQKIFEKLEETPPYVFGGNGIVLSEPPFSQLHRGAALNLQWLTQRFDALVRDVEEAKRTADALAPGRATAERP